MNEGILSAKEVIELERNKENSELEKFNKLRSRGLKILWINLVISLITLLSGYFFPVMKKYVFYSGIYFIFSVFFLVKRYLKRKPKDESNYLFGEKLGNKINSVSQKFIFEAMMVSLVLIIVVGICSSVYAIFFTDISLFLKIITGIGGFFGAIFMTAILITTFQSYKSICEIGKVKNLLTDVTIDLNKEIKENPDSMKGGNNEKT